MKVTLCIDCEFAEKEGPDDPSPTRHCLNTDAPISEFIHGFRNCRAINKGHCKFFQAYKETE